MAFAFRCRICDSKIIDEDVNLIDGLIRCSSCGTVSRSVTPSGEAEPREIPPLPGGMSARETSDHLFIAVRWFHPLHLTWISLVIVLDAALLFGFHQLSAQGVHWAVYVLGPHVYTTLAIIGNYAAAAILLNRTHVSVRKGTLRVLHVPLRCYPFKKTPASEVEQIFTRADYGEGRKLQRCHVCVRLRNGRWFTLVKNLRRLDQAIFIERAVERHLGIHDEPVAGEVPR